MDNSELHMIITIEIEDSKVSDFSTQAKEELILQMNDISQKLVEESLRVEASERLSGNTAEITKSVVKKAAELFLRRYDYVKKKRTNLYIEIAAVAAMPISSFLAPIFYAATPQSLLGLGFSFFLFSAGLVAYVISMTNRV